MRRMIIVALLCALSYAQTESTLQFWGEYLETPLGGLFHLKAYFPDVYELCKNHAEAILKDMTTPVKIIFLEPISAGAYGAVVKIEAVGIGEMALKIFHFSGSRSKAEVSVMNFLAQQKMEDIPRVLLDAQFHEFQADEIPYEGFALEYFPFPNAFEWLSSKVSRIKNPEQRLQILLSPLIQTIYFKTLTIMKKMWSLGVIHGDLHTGNILVDEITQTIKIIDFGKAFIPKRHQEMQFQNGIRHDFLKFSMGYTASVLNPESMGKSSGEKISLYANSEALCKLNPDAKPFLSMNMAQSKEWEKVYESFRRRYGITDGGKEVKSKFENWNDHYINQNHKKWINQFVSNSDSDSADQTTQNLPSGEGSSVIHHRSSDFRRIEGFALPKDTKKVERHEFDPFNRPATASGSTAPPKARSEPEYPGALLRSPETQSSNQENPTQIPPLALPQRSYDPFLEPEHPRRQRSHDPFAEDTPGVQSSSGSLEHLRNLFLHPDSDSSPLFTMSRSNPQTELRSSIPPPNSKNSPKVGVAYPTRTFSGWSILFHISFMMFVFYVCWKQNSCWTIAESAVAEALLLEEL